MDVFDPRAAINFLQRWKEAYIPDQKIKATSKELKVVTDIDFQIDSAPVLGQVLI